MTKKEYKKSVNPKVQSLLAKLTDRTEKRKNMLPDSPNFMKLSQEIDYLEYLLRKEDPLFVNINKVESGPRKKGANPVKDVYVNPNSVNFASKKKDSTSKGKNKGNEIKINTKLLAGRNLYIPKVPERKGKKSERRERYAIQSANAEKAYHAEINAKSNFDPKYKPKTRRYLTNYPTTEISKATTKWWTDHDHKPANVDFWRSTSKPTGKFRENKTTGFIEEIWTNPKPC